MRLRAVAEAVPAGARVADVGTDHAQLLAWLRTTGRIERGIGIDVVPGPLEQARRTLEASATARDIELRRGHGLQPLRPGEVDTIVLAGMGGAKIMQLVDAAPTIVAGLSRLILQPNTDWTAVRRWVRDHGWGLTQESIVEDRGKFYVVLGVTPHADGRERDHLAWDEDALLLGPRLQRERPPAFEAWLQHESRRTARALARARRSRGPDDPRVRRLGEHLARLRRATVADEPPSLAET